MLGNHALQIDIMTIIFTHTWGQHVVLGAVNIWHDVDVPEGGCSGDGSSRGVGGLGLLLSSLVLSFLADWGHLLLGRGEIEHTLHHSHALAHTGIRVSMGIDN